MKKFVPFDGFEKSSAQLGKPLAETMQENPSFKLAAEPLPSCDEAPCPPFWQRSCNIRCLANGLVDAEEEDGCGNTRWVRTPEVVVWVNGDLVTCTDATDENEKEYRIQINQCGDTRHVFTGKYCCTPNWVDVDPVELNCDSAVLQRTQIDGCGNTRLFTSTVLVSWLDESSRRCQDGYHQGQEVNQCGDTRWVNLAAYLWTNTGNTRCTGAVIEAEQQNQCGDLRWQATGAALTWVDTSTETCLDNVHLVQQENQCDETRWSNRGPVAWLNTGITRCGPVTDNVENEQENQCGELRWFDTGVACTSPPPALPASIGGECFVGLHAQGPKTYRLKFHTNGTASKSIPTGTGTSPFNWAPVTVDGGDYEIMVEFDFAGAGTAYSGPTESVWTPLSSMADMQWSITGPTPGSAILSGFVYIRLVGSPGPDTTMEIDPTFISIEVECP